MIMLNNNLRVFVTAAELGSFTEAAKKLYVSQPAVSQAIKKLEKELNVRLFARNKRNETILTDIGKEILALAYKMTDLENRLYQTAYNENHLTGGIVRVASIPLGTSLIMSRVLPQFKQKFPNVQVELPEGSPLEVKKMVTDYQVDLGVGVSPYADLEHEFLLRDRMVSISREKVENIDLRNESADLVLCRVAHSFLTEQLRNRNVDFSHCILVDAVSTQINMVKEGNGRGVVSELMLSTIPNDLIVGEVYPPLEMEISLIARNFKELSTAAKEMANMILQLRVGIETSPLNQKAKLRTTP